MLIFASCRRAPGGMPVTVSVSPPAKPQKPLYFIDKTQQGTVTGKKAMIDEKMKIRREVLRLTLRKPTSIEVSDISPQAAHDEAKRFAKARKIPIDVKMTEAGITVTRIDTEQRASLYPEIDALKVGASHFFDLPPPMHQRIRLAASNRSRSGNMLLSCMREGDGIRVTRLPMNDAERLVCTNIDAVTRSTRWGLEKLEHQPEMRVTLARQDHQKLRLAANRMATKTGWKIRCRLQDDGAMLVYRTDAGAPSAAKQAAE